MSSHVQHIKHIGRDGFVTEKTTRVEDERPTTKGSSVDASVAASIVWYVAGILLTLHAFRFILTLFGANSANPFANFIYDTSHPFVAPFFSLFNYDLKYGVSRFETYTVVAMLVYTVIAMAIARLFTIKRDAEIDSQV